MKPKVTSSCPVGTFEVWRDRPVFVAHCHSWAVASRLGVRNNKFRCLPAFRDELALAERKRVANVIRAERQRRDRIKHVIAEMLAIRKADANIGYLEKLQASRDLRRELRCLQESQALAYRQLA